MHRHHRKLPRPLLGLALGLSLALASAAPAAAQRRSGIDWQIGLGRQTAHGGVQLSVGNRGVELRAGHYPGARRGRPVRVERGHRQHAPSGRWEERCERVWVPGTVQRIWVPPVYEIYYDACGHAHQRLVCAGHWDHVQGPGHWDMRTQRVWVPYRAAISAY